MKYHYNILVLGPGSCVRKDPTSEAAMGVPGRKAGVGWAAESWPEGEGRQWWLAGWLHCQILEGS